ncbi:MAG TPA: hypothetical protein VGS96_11840 [Thermoanaerobaculia bacterium]|jgi:hypothetical protein|nr:hypothetical protein [Thermoanaerobaculia bacterium]
MPVIRPSATFSPRRAEKALVAADRDLVLSTTPFLDRAIALYERCGFRRTDEPPHDRFGTPLFTMRKKPQRDHGGATPFMRA